MQTVNDQTKISLDPDQAKKSSQISDDKAFALGQEPSELDHQDLKDNQKLHLQGFLHNSCPQRLLDWLLGRDQSGVA